MNELLNVIYIGRSRLHRNRANLIQTLHTVAAFSRLGINVRLYLPPWKRNLDVDKKLSELGITSPVDMRPSQLLHARWKLWPFVRFNRKMLREADGVYVRSHHVSLALSAYKVSHHFEVHDTRKIIDEGDMDAIIHHHQTGLIEWLLPISNAASDTLVKYGAVPDRIHVSPSGVNWNVFKSIKRFNPDHLDYPHIVYLGQLIKDHGLDIFNAVAKKNLGRVSLVGNQKTNIEPSDSVRVEQPVPHNQVYKWYEKSDLILLPYQPGLRHAESISPLKLFEALASGRPIIASDLPPIREIIKHGETALLVDPEDMEGWIAAIRQICDNRELASRLAKNSRALAPFYSWDKRAENIARSLGWREKCLT